MRPAHVIVYSVCYVSARTIRAVLSEAPLYKPFPAYLSIVCPILDTLASTVLHPNALAQEVRWRRRLLRSGEKSGLFSIMSDLHWTAEDRADVVDADTEAWGEVFGPTQRDMPTGAYCYKA